MGGQTTAGLLANLLDLKFDHSSAFQSCLLHLYLLFFKLNFIFPWICWWWDAFNSPTVLIVLQDTENSVMTNSTVDRKKRIASIFQHYYPEGGWGVVLLLAVILVQIIIHGLLLSYGVLLAKVVRRFRVSMLESGQNTSST